MKITLDIYVNRLLGRRFTLNGVLFSLKNNNKKNTSTVSAAVAVVRALKAIILKQDFQLSSQKTKCFPSKIMKSK